LIGLGADRTFVTLHPPEPKLKTRIRPLAEFAPGSGTTIRPAATATWKEPPGVTSEGIVWDRTKLAPSRRKM
jgi:hypothetical protein